MTHATPLILISGSSGISLMLLSCLLLRKARAGALGVMHAGYGFGAIGLASISVFWTLMGHHMLSGIAGALTVHFIHLWWKTRNKGDGKKALRELGAKSRALIASLAANLRPSPIPRPARQPV